MNKLSIFVDVGEKVVKVNESNTTARYSLAPLPSSLQDAPERQILKARDQTVERAQSTASLLSAHCIAAFGGASPKFLVQSQQSITPLEQLAEADLIATCAHGSSGAFQESSIRFAPAARVICRADDQLLYQII